MSTQRGMSLISTMVGLVLSMIAAIALMYAYRGIAMSAGTSLQATWKQDQSAAGSLQFMMTVEQAGWGDGPTATPPGGRSNTDIVLLSAATLSGSTLAGTTATISSSPQTGNALIWDSQISGAMQCSALLLPPSNASNGGAIVLLGPQACANAAAWASTTWSAQGTVAKAGTFGSATFSVQTSSCWPFGGGPGAQPAVQVTLNNAGESSVSGVSGAPANSICLVNIPS
jgi:hypothetical protein